MRKGRRQRGRLPGKARKRKQLGDKRHKCHPERDIQCLFSFSSLSTSRLTSSGTLYNVDRIRSVFSLSPLLLLDPYLPFLGAFSHSAVLSKLCIQLLLDSKGRLQADAAFSCGVQFVCVYVCACVPVAAQLSLPMVKKALLKWFLSLFNFFVLYCVSILTCLSVGSFFFVRGGCPRTLSVPLGRNRRESRAAKRRLRTCTDLRVQRV